MTAKARILFVDDEKRVLNAMRGLFRREYELFLASSGADALTIAAQNDIDVIVADQRMPQMTGIEVLSRMRKQSPRTVRILLTGYADPSAIEGSINEGEVFRFLSKPCPPKLLRETLSLAIEAAETKPTPPAPRPAPTATPPVATPSPVAAPAPQQPAAPLATPPSAPSPSSELPSIPSVATPPTPTAEPPQAPPVATTPAPADAGVSSLDETQPNPAIDPDSPPIHEVTEIVMSGSDSSETSQTSTFEALVPGSRDVGVVIFTHNPDFAATVIRAVSDERNTVLATTLAKVAQFINEQNIGVLVTDFTTNATILRKIVNALKQRMPELVTIVASDNRDSEDMINLINYGQVFRYVIKPIDGEKLRTDINAAVVKHLHVLHNPDAGKRYHVGEAPQAEHTDTAVREFLNDFRRPAENDSPVTTPTPTTVKRTE